MRKTRGAPGGGIQLYVGYVQLGFPLLGMGRNLHVLRQVCLFTLEVSRMSSRKRIVLSVLAVAAVLLVFGAWWRMGEVEILVDAAKLPAETSSPQPTEFSVVAYNVQARPVFDDSVHKFERMPAVLNPFDIVTFQECFKDHDRLWAGLTHPVKVYQGTLKNWYRIVGSGLGTVSRFPLTDVESMHYSIAGEFQNKPASKGILLTRFNVGGQPLDVYTTHKEAGKSPEAMVAKRKQGAEMVEFVKANSNADSAVIVLGDFNLRFKKAGTEGTGIPDAPPASFENLEYYQIIGSICASLNLKDLCSEMTGEPYEHVDHILFRSGAKAILTPLSWQADGPEFYDENKKELSDHVPVIGRFRIAPPAP